MSEHKAQRTEIGRRGDKGASTQPQAREHRTRRASPNRASFRLAPVHLRFILVHSDHSTRPMHLFKLVFRPSHPAQVLHRPHYTLSPRPTCSINHTPAGTSSKDTCTVRIMNTTSAQIRGLLH